MTDYTTIKNTIEAIFSKEKNPIIILANSSAVLNEYMTDINWVGFYLVDEEYQQLTLGPFQGKIACTRIKKGKGVCGTAWATDSVQRVDNVHEFDGHIACDSQSESEIVLPIYITQNNERKCIGVLDIDSPILARFTEDDEVKLIEVAELISNALNQTDFEKLLKLLN